MPWDWRILMLPLVGAVIGWVTNAIAIKMLFRPYRPVRFFGLSIQGLLPKRRKEFAESIAKTVEKDLLTVQDIVGFLDGVEWEEEVVHAVQKALDTRLKKNRFSFLLKTPIVGLIGHEVVRQFEKILSRVIIGKIHEHKGRLVRKFQDAIELREVVSRKVEGFEMEKIEAILMRLISRELTWIEGVGAVLGFCIGLIQMVLVLFFS